MIDSAASSSAILLQTADMIKAEIYQLPCRLSTFDSSIEAQRDFTNFTVKSLDRTFERSVTKALVGQILTTEKDRPPRNSDIAHLDYMSDVHFTELDDPTIGVILDASFARAWVGTEVRCGPLDGIIGVLTSFGWTLIGPSSGLADGDTAEVDVCLLDSEEQTIQEMIARMFRHDFIMTGQAVAHPEQIHPSQYDEFALKQMEDSVSFDETIGHYRIALPWREGRSEAAKILSSVDSYSNAKNRLMKEKRKFLLDPVRKEGTFKQMKETSGDGHARLVDPNRDVTGLPLWYMPILVVTRDDKPGKFRVCQDAASKVKGINLNGQLCTGPDLLCGLVGVLLRFRRHKVAVSADIRNFFHMIHVAEEDVAAFRFMFFRDENMNEIDIMESTVHIFGASSSPPVANFVLKFHAKRMREKYGDEVFFLIMQCFYVDDFLCSFPTVEKAREMRVKLTACLKEGGFDLTKWASSHPEVLIDDSSPTSPSPPSLPSQTTPDRERSPENATVEEAEGEVESPPSDNDGDDDGGSASLKEEIERAMKEEQYESAKQFTQPTANPISKVLGVGYSDSDDCLFVRITEKAKIEVKTKRQMLRLVHSVFDPTGLVSPFVLRGRLYFHQANEMVSSWDENLPDEILIPFLKWKETIPLLEKIKIPRWTSTPDFLGSKCDLIVFSDSSKEGYGCVAYIRRYFEGRDAAHVTQLFAKSLVVPTNMHKYPVENQEEHNDSIPRLELHAARLAAVVRDYIYREAGEEFERVIMFTDSNTVLNWICDFDRKFKTFENFRVKKIRLLTSVAEWRHVPSRDNPADICSHGLNANESEKWCLFHLGPRWLSGPESSWPPIRPIPKKVEVVKINAIATFSPIHLVALNATKTMPEVGVPEEKTEDWRLILAQRRSTWDRKVRLIARAGKIYRAFLEFLRAKKGKRDFKKKCDFSLSATDYNQAEIQLLNAVQRKHYDKEIKLLLKLGIFSHDSHNEIRNKSYLTNLSPFLDENLTMRVGSRIGNAESISYEAKFPIILPKDNENIEALVRFEHMKTLHSSINHCFHALRARFHILGGRAAVNNILRKCVLCQMKEKRPQNQKEGELPGERVNLIKPFQATGLDVAGPYGVKQGGRATHKRWILVATCLSTRAVYLLPLKDMTTNTALNAILKLHNLFPGLETIFSDNGSNFRSASREIKEAIKAWNLTQINESLMSKGITWKWSPPNSPHFGGVFERMVRSAKKHLKFILDKEDLNIDVFETALSQVASILNDRPLTYASSDINDFRVLSPSNFLYPYTITPSSTTILPPIPADGDQLRGSWHEVRRLVAIFKERWKQEYLKTLMPRTKWHQSTPNLYIGQIVLMVDEQTPRSDWQIARVDKIISEDNHVRRVRVITPDRRTFERHINKLVVLELDHPEECHDKNEPIMTRPKKKETGNS